ncbi:MAG TPA: TrkA family potassium uptake protein [Candidatus Obscuribacterales bacterium]
MPTKQNPSQLKRRAKRLLRLGEVLVKQFRVFIISSTGAFLLSAMLLYYLYPLKELPAHHHSFLGIAYDTLQMTFFQSPIPFVDDWRLVPIFFGLPILGLVVIAEGVVQLGHLLFQRRTYSKEWQEMLAATYENHIVVAGLGNVGYRVVQQLRKFGEEVVCIERNGESSFIPDLEKLDVPALVGDVRVAQTLENAGIKKAKAFLAVTDDDLANLESALTAREANPGIRIVLRIFDQRLAQKVEKSLGVNCAFSASALAAPVFAQAALSSNILASFEFGGTVVNAFQLTVDKTASLEGLEIDQVRQQFEVTVLMHQRNGSVDWNPPPSTVLASGDKVLIIADNKNIQTFLSCEQGAACLNV